MFVLFEELWLPLLGLAAGILGSMIGLGGGIVVVPVLTFLGFSPPLAASNSLFAAFSNAVASSASYAKQERIQYSLALKFGLPALPGTVLGALISDEISSPLFKALFGIVLLASSVYIFSKRKMEPKAYNLSKQVMVLAVGASFFAGIISSLFGIGGGLVFVPLMVVVIGLTMKLAAPTSQFILLFVSASGMITHAVLGHPDFYQALLLAAGAFAGGLIGSRLSLQVEEKKLKILVSAVMIVAAVKLFIDSLEGSF